MAKILIVDDDQNILGILNTMLQSIGHEVTPALGGEVASKILDQQSFDLMITDIRMSKLDGMELLKIAHEGNPSMAVIMLTAFGQVDTAIQALELGAFDYVKKPFEANEILETVHKALECQRLADEA
jgi:DNA-binding NtrC family response regulator